MAFPLFPLFLDQYTHGAAVLKEPPGCGKALEITGICPVVKNMIVPHRDIIIGVREGKGDRQQGECLGYPVTCRGAPREVPTLIARTCKVMSP